MKRKSLAMLLALACLLLGCRIGENSEKPTKIKNVKTVSPTVIDDVAIRTFPGVVKSANEINLAFKAAGQISRILVKEGDYVREGDLIAELDKKDYLLQLEATQIQYNQLQTEVERLETLYKRNTLPANDYEKAKAGLSALGVQLQAYRNQVEYTVLTSPVSGYVQSVKFAPSEMINAGMTIVALVDVSSVKIETELPASLFLRLNDFIAFSCRTNLAEGQKIPLRFVGINRKANSSQLHKMIFVPESPKSPLAPGMNVEVYISMKEKTEGKTFTLPAKTVFGEEGKSYVWVVENEIVHKREVKTGGMAQNGELIILSGISENEEVVQAGLRTLQENDRVNIIQSATETNVGGLL